MGKTKFIFNRGAFSDQVLKSPQIQARTKTALRQAIGGDEHIVIRDQTQGKTRNGVVAIGPASHKGKLQQVLASMQVT